MNYQNDDDPLFSSWDMLGTNLSIKIDTHMWDTEAGMNTNLNENYNRRIKKLIYI